MGSRGTLALVFHKAAFPFVDSSGFETCLLQCRYCGTSLVGIIDPFDGTPLAALTGSVDCPGSIFLAVNGAS